MNLNNLAWAVSTFGSTAAVMIIFSATNFFDLLQAVSISLVSFLFAKSLTKLNNSIYGK
jgi:hypothetical protein